MSGFVIAILSMFFKIFGVAAKIDSALNFKFFRRSDSNKVHHVLNGNGCNQGLVTCVTIKFPRIHGQFVIFKH